MDYDGGSHIMRRVEVVEIDDTGEDQFVTVHGLDGEYWKLAVSGQDFGLAGVPPKGSVGYLMCANGRPDQGFLIGMRLPGARPRNQLPGETTLYGQAGNKVVLDKDGNVTLGAGAGGIVHLNPP